MTDPILYHHVMDSPHGELTLVAGDNGLRAVLWPDDEGRVPLPDSTPSPDHPVIAAAADQLREYFSGRRTEFDLPLDPRGTEFQMAVWRSLADIPFGETISYGEQARRIGRPTAVRAVGAANGKNPLSIVLPCHRVVGANGALTGFASGIDTKAALLDHEVTVRALSGSG
jgi:methylated-DNA-[protein]-cysteine S-methyltransferase